MSSLTPTARVILGMLKLGVPTGYDIKKAIDGSTRFFWRPASGRSTPSSDASSAPACQLEARSPAARSSARSTS